MGMVLGKIGVETPKYKVMASTSDYQVRKYPPSVVAEITYRPSDFKSDKDGGFTILAKYIGAFGNPQNKRPEEPIAMTAPVITKTASSETIAMTVPVVTKSGGNDEEVTMGFILPSKYSKTEDAPRPVDERVVIREEGEKKYGVVKFSGVARENVVEKKVEELRKCLERDGYKAAGDFVLASATNLRPIVATLSRSREKRGWCRCYADQAPLPTKRGHRQLLDPPPPTQDPSPAAAAHANGAAFRFNVGGR